MPKVVPHNGIWEQQYKLANLLPQKTTETFIKATIFREATSGSIMPIPYNSTNF